MDVNDLFDSHLSIDLYIHMYTFCIYTFKFILFMLLLLHLHDEFHQLFLHQLLVGDKTVQHFLLL